MKFKNIVIFLLIIITALSVGFVIVTKKKYKTLVKHLEVHERYSAKLLAEYEEELANITKKDYIKARQSVSADENIGFCIVVPSYNNVEYVKQNLNSVFRQDYHNWRLIYVDDASTDGTSQLVAKIKADSLLDDKKLSLTRNNPRQRSVAYSIYNSAHNFCNDKEVMVILDGDDMLADSSVLSQLASYYDNSNIWATYGSFVTVPYGNLDAEFSKDVSKSDWLKTRSIPWSFSHLKTAYTWLFKKISVADLKYKGEFIHAAGDMAIMLPMVEMAGKNRTKFIKDATYLYRLHDRNESSLYTQEQRDMDQYVRSLKRYPELSKDYKPPIH